MFDLPAEHYLEQVKDWEDPYHAPIVIDYDGFQVVRDDLLDFGSKIRFIDYLIQSEENDEWVFGGANPVGWGPISLTFVCKKYGKKATFFMAERKVPTPQQQKVLDLGGNIIWVKMGMLTVTLSRARKYFEEDQLHRRILPLGLNHPKVLGSIIKVTRKLKCAFPEIWSVASSGTMSRGLQLSFPEIPVKMVQTGHKMSQDEIGRAQLFVSPYKFDKPVKLNEAPPFPSVPEYDAKAWSFMKKYGKEGALFWNVAGNL